MKRKISLAFLLLSFFSICFSNENSGIDLDTFLKNPFLKMEMYPQIFDSYSSFEEFFLNDTFKITSEIKENKYDKSKPHTRYRLEKEDILLVYLCSGSNGKCFLELMSIIPNQKEPLKHNLYEGMNEDSIIEIFGNNFYKQIHEKNYEICFFGNSTWQVNFSFSNYTKQLSTVNFWYGVD